MGALGVSCGPPWCTRPDRPARPRAASALPAPRFPPQPQRGMTLVAGAQGYGSTPASQSTGADLSVHRMEDSARPLARVRIGAGA